MTRSSYPDCVHQAQKIVDLTDPTVLGLIGLTAEIHSTSACNLTQSWALALHEAGYDGIRYKARHEPRGQLVSFALFGSGKPPRSAAKTTAIPVDLIHEASATLAITVLPAALAAPVSNTTAALSR